MAEGFDPTGISTGIGLVADIFKGIAGYNQAEEGKGILKGLKRPTYTTPNEIYGNLNLAKSAFLDSRLPGQSVAENKIQGNTAQAVQLAQMYGKSPAEIMATISGANANENNAFNDLTTKAGEFHFKNLDRYMGANEDVANHKDTEFNVNQLQPYNQDRQYAMDLIGAGNKNLYGAIGEGGALLGTDAANDGLGNLYNKFFGGGKKASFTGYSSGKTNPIDGSAFSFN